MINEKPYIIGITGGSGSGKTLFVHKLVAEFKPEEVCLVSQDNYYKNRENQPRDPRGYQNFDLPESMFLDRFEKDVNTLISGKRVSVKEYTYNNPDLPARSIRFVPSPILILEGLFVFHQEKIRDLIDFSIFVHAMEHIMLTRRIIRDEEERGYDLDDVLYRYQNHVMPAYRKYILPCKETCDVVINNNSGFDRSLQMIRSHIRNILRQE